MDSKLRYCESIKTDWLSMFRTGCCLLFLNEAPGTSRLWYQRRQMIQHLLQVNGKNDSPLPYIIIDGPGLEKKVRLNSYRRQLIFDNYPVIRGWIQLKKVKMADESAKFPNQRNSRGIL